MIENTTIRLTPATCATDNCGRAVPFDGHRFCRDCIGTVLRTGHPPVLVEPTLVRLAREKKLPAKILLHEGVAA